MCLKSSNAIKLTRNSQIKQIEQHLLWRAKDIRSGEQGGYALVAAAVLKKAHDKQAEKAPPKKFMVKLSRRNVHGRDAVPGNFWAWIRTIWPTWLQGSFQKTGDLSGLAAQGLAAEVDRVGEVDTALVF